jgi:hypothetical protein
VIDKATISSLLDDLEDEDDAATGKKGLAALDPSEPPPAKGDGSEDDKLAALVASLSPEEKAKLRALLDEDEGAPAPADKGAPPEEP